MNVSKGYVSLPDAPVVSTAQRAVIRAMTQNENSSIQTLTEWSVSNPKHQLNCLTSKSFFDAWLYCDGSRFTYIFWLLMSSEAVTTR